LLPAIYYVRQHYGEKISLEVAAARCGLKHPQLTRLFHRTYGLTFRDYVVRYRLREARRLLRDPGAKVADVAEIVGFTDFSYFSRMFKRHFGLQPSEHRGTPPVPPGEGINTESTAQMLRLPPVP
jgi:two-component system response regulator YesN